MATGLIYDPNIGNMHDWQESYTVNCIGLIPILEFIINFGRFNNDTVQ